jgi:hypothetical protein
MKHLIAAVFGVAFTFGVIGAAQAECAGGHMKTADSKSQSVATTESATQMSTKSGS